MIKRLAISTIAYMKQDEFNFLGYHFQKKTVYKFVVAGWIAKAAVTIIFFKLVI